MVIANIIERVGRWARGRYHRAPNGQRRHPARGPTRPETADLFREPPPLSPEGSEPSELEELSTRAKEVLSRRVLALMEKYKGAPNDSDALDLAQDLTQNSWEMIRRPPLAAQQILAVCGRREFALEELTRLIERDPAMTQSLLRHANSAWYATAGAVPVVAIGPAVQRIGTTGVYGSVMSRIIASELSRPGSAFRELARQVWDHMIRVAPLARSFARAFGANPEEAFTAGLLHDVGKLVIFDAIAELRRRKRRAIELPDEFLREALATLHESIGGLAALRWGLPGHYAEAILSHQRDPVPDEPSTLGEVLHLAERIDVATEAGTPVELDDIWESAALTGSLDTARKIWAELGGEPQEDVVGE